MSTKKKAYLYGRVSTATQAENGHGLERQLKAALKFLENRQEYEIDTSNIIQDAGVSAYSGGNIAASAGLGGFLAVVRKGLVPRGSLLVIEAPDRLSRLGIRKGQRLFDEFADHGIDIGLVRFGTIIRHDDENDFQSSLIVSVGLYLGHLESKQKSERICSTMSDRREEMRKGERVTVTQRPRYLDASPDGKSFVLGESAKAVQEIFRLRLQGYGSGAIADKLNEAGYPHTTPDGIWKKHNVTYYLRSRTVIGEYQPHTIEVVKGKRNDVPSGAPIKGYYPQLVSEEDFYAVQEMVDKASGGRKEVFNNYLRGIAICPVCGHHTVYRSTSAKGKRFNYLRCMSSEKNYDAPNCGYKAINYERITKYVTPALLNFNYVDIYNNGERGGSDNTHHQVEIESIEKSIEDNRQALTYLSGAARDAVIGVIKDSEKELIKLKSAMLTNTGTMSIEEATESERQLKESELGTPEGRARFNELLKKFVDHIHFHNDSWSIVFADVPLKVRFHYETQDVNAVIKSIFENREALSTPSDDIDEVRRVLGSKNA